MYASIDSVGVLCHGRGVGSDYPRRARDAACGLGDVVGEPLAVERGAGEQQLDVEEWRPAAADAVEPVLVLELADHALGVSHPPLVREDATLALAARAGGERLFSGDFFVNNATDECIFQGSGLLQTT